MSSVGQRSLNKRMMTFVIIVGLLLIFLAAIGFGTPNLGSRLVFAVWGIFIVAMAIAAWHWWGRGIFKEKRP